MPDVKRHEGENYITLFNTPEDPEFAQLST
jgi:hypothetical protein